VLGVELFGTFQFPKVRKSGFREPLFRFFYVPYFQKQRISQKFSLAFPSLL